MTARLFRKAGHSCGISALATAFAVVSLVTSGIHRDHYATCTDPAGASALIECVIDAPDTKDFTAEVRP